MAACVPLELATEAHYDNIMNVNFRGAYFTLARFIPVLHEGASVIFLSSVNATGLFLSKNTLLIARPKAFDENAALEKAMQLFWKKGYNATSMEERS